MNLNNWFDKGLLTDEYEKQLDDHKDNYYNIFNNYEVPEDEEFFSQLKNKNWRAIVLAEVWCGHCMLNIPIFLKIAEKANMPVRFLNRDRKSTRLNSSHVAISYAVFCLKKKKKKEEHT